MKIIAALLVSFLLAAPACAQVQQREVAPAHESFTMQSKSIGESRVVNVYLPPGYAASSDHYDVLYMPDGGLNEDFPHIATTIDEGIAAGEVRPLILVGIPNTERRRDLTGPTSVRSDRKVANVVGGAPLYRAFIKDELIPEINRRYRTTSSRGIIGDSLAAYFIVETFMLDPSMFDTYLAMSPSLWWNAAALSKAPLPSITSPTRVDFSVADETDIVPNLRTLGSTLKSSAPASLTWEVRELPDQKHGTIYRDQAPSLIRKYYPAR